MLHTESHSRMYCTSSIQIFNFPLLNDTCGILIFLFFFLERTIFNEEIKYKMVDIVERTYHICNFDEMTVC